MARTKARSSARPARRQTAAKRRAAPKVTSTARRQTKPQQRFVVSHHREEDFEGGLRRYAKYRDLGIARATNGMVRAHVIRFIPPCRPEESREAEGTAEADVQCQSLPSGRLSGGWLAELREIPRSRHEQGHQWPAAGARHPLHPAV